MSPIQTLILVTTGFILPPLAVLSTAEPASSEQKIIIASDVSEVSTQPVQKFRVGEATVFISGPNDDNGSREPLTIRLADNDVAEAEVAVTINVERNDIEPGGPWIGIRFGPVPEALASHLQLAEGVGQMVLNVAVDSPADKAGIQQYDVITSIDDSETSTDMGEFLDVVRNFAINETHDFRLIRRGDSTRTSLTVGARPERMGPMKYKQEAEVAITQGDVFKRGGLMEKDEAGNWSFRRFEGLEDIPDIWRMIPDINEDDRVFSWHGVFPGVCDEAQLLFKHGDSVSIRRDDDGKVTVTKTETKDGKNETTTHVYDSEELFKQSDPKTYERFNSLDSETELGRYKRLHEFASPSMKDNIAFYHNFGADFDLDWSVELGGPELERIKEAFETLQGRTETLKDHIDNLKKAEQALRKSVVRKSITIDGKQNEAAGKAKTQFTVTADGGISIITRLGEDELVLEYENVDQLKTARPDLYDKYQRLIKSDIDVAP